MLQNKLSWLLALNISIPAAFHGLQLLSSPNERKVSKIHKVLLSLVLQILGEYFITAPDAWDLHVQFVLPPPVSWLFAHLLRGLCAHQCHRASWLKALLRSPTGFPGSLAGKESTGSSGDPSSIPGLGRSPGEGIGYPFQYSWASLVAQTIKNPPECRRSLFDPWVGIKLFPQPPQIMAPCVRWAGRGTHYLGKGFLIPRRKRCLSADCTQRGWMGQRHSPGGGNSYPLQYSCLENSMNRGAWQAKVHGIAELDTTDWLSLSLRSQIGTGLNVSLAYIIVKISSFPESSISPSLKWGLIRIAISGLFQTLNNKMYLYSGWQIMLVIITVC